MHLANILRLLCRKIKWLWKKLNLFIKKSKRVSFEIVLYKNLLEGFSKSAAHQKKKTNWGICFWKNALSPTLETLGIAEKMTGYEDFYKIRFGDYRIGLNKTSTHIELIRVLHRKEIYKLFP